LTTGLWGAVVVLVAGVVGLITTLNAFVIGSSRLILGMAREGVLPEFMASVHPRFGTPYWGILFITLLGILGAVFQELFLVFQIASSAILIAFILVLISFIKLRKNRPDMERPYKAPYYPALPYTALLGSIAAFLFSLVAFETWVHWAIFIGVTAAGLLYYAVSVKHKEIKDIMASTAGDE